MCKNWFFLPFFCTFEIALFSNFSFLFSKINAIKIHEMASFSMGFWMSFKMAWTFECLTTLMTFKFFNSQMNGIIMNFKTFSSRKWFPTCFTFKIFMSFMDCMNVFLQTSCFRKWFTTRFAIVIFVAFVNCVNVFLQTSCMRKWFTTRFTFVIFVAFMKCVSSNFLLQKMFYCKIHICDLCGFHELSGCASSN